MIKIFNIVVEIKTNASDRYFVTLLRLFVQTDLNKVPILMQIETFWRHTPLILQLQGNSDPNLKNLRSSPAHFTGVFYRWCISGLFEPDDRKPIRPHVRIIKTSSLKFKNSNKVIL